MTPATAAGPVGLCASCEHHKTIRNTRGSTFLLCRRAAWDPALERYPRLPRLSCHGHRHGPASHPAPAGLVRDG